MVSKETGVATYGAAQEAAHEAMQMASAFPQKAKEGLCAMMSCCFQPARGPGSDDEHMYMLQGRGRGSDKQDATGDQNAILAGYQQPPRWLDDAFMEACVLCGVQFDLLTRKHHCRGCGLVFCGKCASHFDRVAKFALMEPVRLCHSCDAQAKMENVFYEQHLPLLESGEVFSKYGLLRKRLVHLKFVREKNLFQYQKVDPETRSYEGEIKAIPLDAIAEVREVEAGQDNADLGLILVTEDQEHRLDAPTALKRQQWVDAIESARAVRGAMLAAEREKRAKQVERENAEIKKMSEHLQKMEESRASFQEDRMRRRAEKREQLRAKYNLATAAS